MDDLNNLIESFPKIWRLKGKKVLIKFGGSTLKGNGDLERFSREIALLVSLGLRPIVVHGGGSEISDEMQERGMDVQKVAGLRITDHEAIEVVKEVLRRINTSIVEALESVGIKAIGMPASEKKSVICSRFGPVETMEDGQTKMVDLGLVGKVESVDPNLISLLCASGFVPIIFPICCDRRGTEMNVNADTVAAHLAHGLGCEEMIMVTDVPGVMKKNGDISTLINQISMAEIDNLINEGIISGGMTPKVEACRLALSNGVKEAHLVNGATPHSIINQLLSAENCGTRFVPK